MTGASTVDSTTLPLEYRQVSVVYRSRAGVTEALHQVDLRLEAGRILALIGESGSGKSTMAWVALGLLSPSATRSGEVFLNGRSLDSLGVRMLRSIRGGVVGVVVQEAGSSLDPLRTTGSQAVEVVRSHQSVTRREAAALVSKLFQEVGLSDSERIARSFPHELSGGQQQRVAVALALAGNPSVLIADEPTSALDWPRQRQILDLLRSLRDRRGLAILLISHDLAAAADLADEIAVIESGQLVERGSVSDVLRSPVHPATRRLVENRLRLTFPPLTLSAETHSEPLLVIDKLEVAYPSSWWGRRLRRNSGPVLKGVSLHVGRRETLALVGPSGSGKTTLLRVILGLLHARGGRVQLHGADNDPRSFRRRVQWVPQDPLAALNPRHTVSEVLSEPLLIHKIAANSQARGVRVTELLEEVGLPPTFIERYPHELSGGQRQRLCIARALAVDPELILLDEPLASLDTTMQIHVLNLLTRLQRSRGLSYLFITHDLRAVAQFADRVAVLHAGQVVEEGIVRNVLSNPHTEYTRELIEAMPRDIG